MNSSLLDQLHFGQAADILVPSLVHGASLVIETTIIGFLLAMIVGTLIAVGRLFAWRPFKVLLYSFLELIRGTPLLV